MRIRKPGIIQVEIGELDHTVRLPMASRLSVGMKTICDACGTHIMDEYFVAGFKAGHANLKLHEACAGIANLSTDTETSTSSQNGGL